MEQRSTIQTKITRRQYKSLKSRGCDLISVLWADALADVGQEASQRLLRLKDADGPDDRRTLDVCAECRDTGCGAITIVEVFEAGTGTWREFGYEDNYEPGVSFGKNLEDLGPDVFSREDDSGVVNDARFELEELS